MVDLISVWDKVRYTGIFLVSYTARECITVMWSFHFNSNDQCSPLGSLTRSRIPCTCSSIVRRIRLLTVTSLARLDLQQEGYILLTCYIMHGSSIIERNFECKQWMVVVHFSHKQLKYADIVSKFSGIKLEAYFIDISNLKERRKTSTSYAIRFTVYCQLRRSQFPNFPNLPFQWIISVDDVWRNNFSVIRYRMNVYLETVLLNQMFIESWSPFCRNIVSCARLIDCPLKNSARVACHVIRLIFHLPRGEFCCMGAPTPIPVKFYLKFYGKSFEKTDLRGYHFWF